MSIRDRLLALVRAPDYSPANEYELARRLELGKKQRPTLAHELRLILKTGEFARGGNGRITRRSAEPARPAKVESRTVFTPSARGGRAPTRAE